MSEPEEKLLDQIEDVAVELATLAGAEIHRGLGEVLSVSYKGADVDKGILTDPVSEVDRRIETTIRAVLGDTFPDHGIIGEEFEAHTDGGPEWVWALDPVDGTANFVNGFPMCAASVGVLLRGRPVAGALWCSATHRLGPGVYHARRGGPVCFEGDPLGRERNPAVKRHLAGTPDAHPETTKNWDARKTGSAAIECAFVAAGLLQVAHFASPHVWDVAGGLALVEAAGGSVRQHDGNGWCEDSLIAEDAEGLKAWRRAVIIGEPAAADQMQRIVG